MVDALKRARLHQIFEVFLVQIMDIVILLLRVRYPIIFKGLSREFMQTLFHIGSVWVGLLGRGHIDRALLVVAT